METFARRWTSADENTCDMLMYNSLGQAAVMQQEYRDGHKESVQLPANETTLVRQPVPQRPLSHANLHPQVSPPVGLLIDIISLENCTQIVEAGSLEVDLKVGGRLKGFVKV